jgi:hypothetical protein
MPTDEFHEERERIVEDTKRSFRLSQLEQGQPDPAKYGFPQDNPTPPADPNNMDGGVPGGTPSPDGGAPPPGGGAPGGGGGALPQSLDDLPTEEELNGGGAPPAEGGEEEQIEEETRGRPRTGPQYAQDSHVRGRDPLGFKERYRAMQVSAGRAPSKKSPLSLEIKQALDSLKGGKTPTILSEDAGTFLDESILNIEE